MVIEIQNCRLTLHRTKKPDSASSSNDHVLHSYVYTQYTQDIRVPIFG